LQEIIPGKIMVFSAVMLRIAFLSRVAFIANACFVMIWLLRYLPMRRTTDADSFLRTLLETGIDSVASLILITGLTLSFLMNPIVNIWYAVILICRQPLKQHVPVWLAVINFLFLIIQLYLIF
jgi:hypothetical protein